MVPLNHSVMLRSVMLRICMLWSTLQANCGISGIQVREVHLDFALSNCTIATKIPDGFFLAVT